MLSEQEHPVLGRITMPNVPFKSSEVDAIPRTPAPLMGQHNREILSTLLGYALAEVADLERDGALYAEEAVGRLARDQPAPKGQPAQGCETGGRAREAVYDARAGDLAYLLRGGGQIMSVGADSHLPGRRDDGGRCGHTSTPFPQGHALSGVPEGPGRTHGHPVASSRPGEGSL